MSVKEARKRVESHFDFGHEDDPDSYAALDRFILEVQAEMPCYLVWQEHLGPDDVVRDDDYCDEFMEMCPSCKARAELKVPA